MTMNIPTEPIGSIPRPAYLTNAMRAYSSNQITQEELLSAQDQALIDTIRQFEQTGSPVITDGEQSKSSFVTYPLEGMTQLASDGIVIPFADGHTRQLPRITGGRFKYSIHANRYLNKAKAITRLPVKQAVISASALSLLYPPDGVAGYPRDQFVADLLDEAEADIRMCLQDGAHTVQIDFTEARLAVKLDPSRALLKMLVDLNNQVLDRFTAKERIRIGIHTCPGGDHDSTHSADVEYADLLPDLFNLHVSNFYLEYAAEKNKKDILKLISRLLKPSQRVYLGVTNVLNPRIESSEEICDLVLEAASYISADQIGTTDDCGFSPFADDVSTAREIAFAKIKARVDGTALAEKKLG
jgi:5-methyltetrahydropteroyltriglutamate--homocysteine methyltransferase